MSNVIQHAHVFLSGAIVAASWTIAFFFLRFQRSTRDRLFGCFAAAFALFGVEHIVFEILPANAKSDVYLIRLAAFLLILFGIWHKNRREKAH